MNDDVEADPGRALGSEPAAVRIASNADTAEAREYLREQIALTKLQKQNLIEQNAFELSHLRWRRFNDQMKGALQIMLVLIGAAIVIGIAAAIWNASNAEGLVVDSFVVPPGYTQAGVTGSVVADDITQKIAAIHDFVSGYSLPQAKNVREAHDQDVRVEIPETGISIAEAWRYLRQWFGNEQHLNGNLRTLADNRIALTVWLGGSDSFVFAGRPGDLNELEQKAAERVFARIDPINYVLYLAGKNRNAETLAAAANNLSLWTANRDRAEAYTLFADMTLDLTGDVGSALARTNLAMALDPKSTPPHMMRLHIALALGHDEDVVNEAQTIAGLKQEDNVVSWRTGNGYPFVQELAAISRANETGDFASLSTLQCRVKCSLAGSTLLHAEGLARLHDVKHASDLTSQAETAGAPYRDDLARTQYYKHAAMEDWGAGVADARQFANALISDKSYAARLQRLRVQTQAIPLLAHALAASGDFAAARKAIEGTPLDCYACLRERGDVESLAKNWRDASDQLARAANAAPSIPFAYSDWGEMLLAKGDYDGAIVKFETAHAKGPHFADPLEMWGEALIAKNRSDLALAKFEEANKYAPNWGRLHLKWGEALYYAGKKEEAKKQFAIAPILDLSNGDKSALARWRGKE